MQHKIWLEVELPYLERCSDGPLKEESNTIGSHSKEPSEAVEEWEKRHEHSKAMDDRNRFRQDLRNAISLYKFGS